MHHLLLIIHLIAATIWVGGHLVLAIGYMPRALKYKDFSYIGNFEKKYEPIGMPSLLLLVITGISMTYDYNAGLKSNLPSNGLTIEIASNGQISEHQEQLTQDSFTINVLPVILGVLISSLYIQVAQTS